MPTYTFKNEKTGEIWDDLISMSERELLLKENSHIKQLPPTQINIVRGTSTQKSLRNDDGWRENLSRIAEAHPNSALADSHGDKSIKAVKTRKALEKWRKKMA